MKRHEDVIISKSKYYHDWYLILKYSKDTKNFYVLKPNLTTYYPKDYIFTLGKEQYLCGWIDIDGNMFTPYDLNCLKYRNQTIAELYFNGIIEGINL